MKGEKLQRETRTFGTITIALLDRSGWLMCRDGEIELFQCLADGGGAGGGGEGGAVTEEEVLEFGYELGESISHIVTSLIV